MKILRLLCVNVLIFLVSSCSNNAGKKAPVFTANALSGKKIDANYLKNKTVVLKIWATWCGSCVKEIPELNALVEKYKADTTVVFISITDDKRDKIELFLKKRPFAYEHLTDAQEIKNLFYGGLRQEIPKHMIVDKNGFVVFDQSGEINNIAAVLSSKIDQVK
jgi:peroxiredoxin